MIRCRHARERRHRLALTARRHDDDLLGTEVVDLVDADDRPFWRIQIAEFEGNADHILHAAAENSDAALVLYRRVNDLLNAVHVRGECRNDDTTTHVMKRLVKRRTDCTLTRCMSLALCIRAVCEEEQNPLVAKLGEAAEIRHLPIDRRIVELEVTRVDDHAHGGLDREPNRIGDRVIHADKADTEAADIDDIPRHHRVQIARINAVFLETPFENPERQTRPIDGYRDLLHYIWQGTDMILVPVRENNRFHLVPVFDQIGNIRNDKVDAEHVLLREHEPGVDHKNLIIHADGSHVLSDLAKTAERYDLYFLHIFPMIAITI